MNRLEIAVTLLSGKELKADIDYSDDVENAFQLADLIIEHDLKNKTFINPDSHIEKLVLENFDWNKPSYEWRWLQASQLLIELGFDNPSKHQASVLASVIKQKNCNTSKKSNGKKLLLCPPLK